MPLSAMDVAYVADMLDAAYEVRKFLKDVTYADLAEDQMRCRAVERSFEILGEAARQLSQVFRDKFPDLPLSKVIGLRNVIAHGYADVDYRVLFRVANEDLPGLMQKLERLLPPTPESR